MGVKLGFLTLREEHRMKAFENRLLRTISGPKREEIIGGWRKLHSEELHKSRKMRWTGFWWESQKERQH
jgi:hypothetical protein